MVVLSVVKTASQEVRRNMASFKEVRNNMSEGLRFYMSLQEAIAVLAQQAGDYILTRRLQRWDLVLVRLLWDMVLNALPPILQHSLAGCFRDWCYLLVKRGLWSAKCEMLLYISWTWVFHKATSI